MAENVGQDRKYIAADANPMMALGASEVAAAIDLRLVHGTPTPFRSTAGVSSRTEGESPQPVVGDIALRSVWFT